MNRTIKILFVLLTVLSSSAYAQVSSTVQGRIVDGAGRPIEGVQIKLFAESGVMPYLSQSYNDFIVDTGQSQSITSDKEGKFQATASESLDHIRLSFGKKGYQGFTISANLAARRDALVLHKSVSCDEIKKLAEIQDKDVLKNSLTEIITSDEFSISSFGNKDCDIMVELFKINDHLGPVLSSMLDNTAILPGVGRLMAYFAYEDDLRPLISALLSKSTLNHDQSRSLRHELSGSLVSPRSEDEWDLLKSAITCDPRYGGSEPLDFGVEQAALALAANGSKRALTILKTTPTCVRPPAYESSVRLAIKWIDKHPGPVELYSDLSKSIESSARIFNYSEKPERVHVDKVITDRTTQKALVFCSVNSGDDDYIYELVFRKEAGLWKLKGLWLTSIAYVIRGELRKLPA